MARDGTKTGGRQAGSLNKKTIEEIDRAARVLNLIESKYLEKDIAQLSPNQRMLLYADMMEYKAPKLSRTTIEGNADNPVAVNMVEGLTFEQLYQLKHGAKPI
jgi:hypothetical protein